MLPEAARLRDRRLFARILNSDRGVRLAANAHFALIGLPRPSQATAAGSAEPPAWPRFGLLISKKVDKRAARRNRIRRQLRELLRRRFLPGLPEALYDYACVVIIVRQAAQSASFGELEDSLGKLLVRVKPAKSAR